MVMFVVRNLNTCYYVKKDLFLLFNGRICPISHNQVLNSFAGVWRVTAGLFCFGYLPDSGANDPRLIGAQERELKEAVGETRVKGTVPVARERRSTEGTIRVGGIVSVCFLGVGRKLFFLRSILKEKYVRELPNQRDRY
jgi:hypothetical protein